MNKVFYSKGQRIIALENINLEIKPGEFVSLLGPSGCGKTTLLHIIDGLTAPSSGVVRFDNVPQVAPRREFGVMFQNPVLLPWRTVRRNLALPTEILHMEQETSETRINEVLQLVGLTEFADRYPHELSGGMAQRVALCRLLMFDPDVLLMDEPFGALDEFTREAMNLELLRIWKDTGKTIVFVTHNISEAVFMSDRVVVMTPRPGRIAGIQTSSLPRPRYRELLASSELTEHVREIRSLLDFPPLKEAD